MAKDFISDEEMKALEESGEAVDFISDEQMEELEGPGLVSARGLGKAALEALPIAGGAFGGALGLASPIPGGAMTGAAVGAAAGKALENIGERFLLDEEKSREGVYLEPVAEGASAAAGEGFAPLVGKAISKGADMVGTGIKKTVSSLSSIPEKAIETFMDRPQAVKAVGKLSEETALQDAADKLRQEAVQAISDFKADANDEIGYVLLQKGDQLINVSSIKDTGNKIISKLNPKIVKDAEQITEIQKMIDQFTNLQINPKLPFVKATDVNRMKQVMQDAADYTADGVIKQQKGVSDHTFKAMAREARKSIEKLAPEIKVINQNLSKLHNVNKNINKNLISPEKTAASVMGVGSGQNQQAVKQMRKLEDLTGFNYVGRAQEIASAQHFNDPSLIPTISTGRAAIPAMGIFGAGQQFLSGNVAPAMGSLAFGAMGSPMAIKAGMDAINIGKTALGVMSPLGGAQMAEELLKRGTQMGVQPFVLDGMIKGAEFLTPTEKAKLRNQNAKSVK